MLKFIKIGLVAVILLIVIALVTSSGTRTQGPAPTPTPATVATASIPQPPASPVEPKPVPEPAPSEPIPASEPTVAASGSTPERAEQIKALIARRKGKGRRPVPSKAEPIPDGVPKVEIFREDYRVGMLATYESEAIAPVEKGLERHQEVYDQIRNKGREKLFRKYGITASQLEAIEEECMKQGHWKDLPNVPNPY